MAQNTTGLKVVFAGTPEFAARHLQALLQSQHDVMAVYTQPDRPAGRGKKLQASPVKQLAQENEIPVHQPISLKNPEAQDTMNAINFDIMVVVAYGLILPKAVLDIPKFGCINVHGSLLPKWRGAAPIQRAIWAGDTVTGITIMNMDVGLDTGDMLLKSELPIEVTDTSASLYEKLAQSGPRALIQALDSITMLTPEKQDETAATYAHKLEKSEGLIDWTTDGQQLERNIRAFNPWPGTWFEHHGQNIKVWQAQWFPEHSDEQPGTILKTDKQAIQVNTGNGVLYLKQLQLPGKKAQPVADILNARPEWFSAGLVLGASH